MTAATAAAPAGTGGVGFGRVLRSEWLKLVTVRSTFWTTAVALLLAALTALLFGAAVDPGSQGGTATALDGSTVSLSFVALVVGVLGVLAIGGEYATLQIRSSYTAVPRRWPALVAKALVVAAWSFVLGAVITFGSFGLIAVLYGGKGVSVGLDGEAVGVLIGGAVYLAVIGAFAVGLGALVRASAAGITVLTALLFVAPIILALIAGALQAEWALHANDLLLSNAGGVLFTRPAEASMALWAALLALAGWLAVVWVPALLLTQHRDV
ncbi:ABC transporter permease [Amnibacterium soli]|uniref:ABC transporter permease n=1 Tax=Amnibacterium soli TaxID=1282736 RepID=A0ABP8YWC0_9MICO